MKYISLFTGAGGGDLAMQHLLRFRCVGYIEYEKYCQKLIKQRIEDGFLDAAPIFGDIRDFIGEGYAEAYKGMVDLVTGGPPCQGFSVAGKQLKEKDERNMFPEAIKVVRAIMPKFVLFENVPGSVSYLPVAIRGLRRAGYTVRRPRIVAAASVGAGHIRQRVWLYANNDEKGQQNTERFSASKKKGKERRSIGIGYGKKISEGWTGNNWWSAEPGVGRVVYGIPNGVDRLAALGNGQVPAVAATAFRILSEEMTE